MRNAIFFVMIFIFGCSGNHTIGLKPHSFGSKAKHIIWLQVPGLALEHLTFLKMDKPLASDPIAFENMACLGNVWSHSLLELRPKYFDGFQSQILGSKSVEGECDDFDRPAVWNYFEKVGYNTSFYEVVSKKGKRFYEQRECDAKVKTLENTVVWVQGPNKENGQTFHFQENKDQKEPGVYFDRSCNKKECFSDLNANVRALWNAWVENNPKTFFTLRDTDFYDHLVKKDYVQAKSRLAELEKLITYFMERSQRESILILVTSSEARDVEFPRSGKSWNRFKKNILYKRSKLSAPLWANGPGAENFCGTFEESDVSKRILWTPEKNLLKLTF